MKFFQGGPLKHFNFTFEALGVVYDMNTHDDDDVSELKFPILVDFLLENVKPTKSITTTLHEVKEYGALHIASLFGRVEVVKKLVQKLRDPNFPTSDGLTPMSVAAFRGELEIVMILAANTEHPISKDRHGWTPIDMAAYRGHLEIVKFLVNLDDTIVYYSKLRSCN